MIEVNIEGTVYNLPTSVDEVSLRKYIEISNITEENRTRNSAKILAILMGCDVNYILNCDINQFSELCFHLSFLSELENIKDVADSTVIDGVTYVIQTDFTKITAGQMSDIELIGENKKGNESLPYIIATFLKEEGDAVRKSTEEKAELIMDKMNLKDALAISLFFSNSVTLYMKNLSSFLKKKVEKEDESEK